MPWCAKPFWTGMMYNTEGFFHKLYCHYLKDQLPYVFFVVDVSTSFRKMVWKAFYCFKFDTDCLLKLKQISRKPKKTFRAYNEQCYYYYFGINFKGWEKLNPSNAIAVSCGRSFQRLCTSLSIILRDLKFRLGSLNLGSREYVRVCLKSL